MKKYFAIIITLAVASCACIGFAQSSIAASKNDVSYSEHTVLGDASYAEGLVVNDEITLGDYLFWSTHLKAGKTADSENDYTFYSMRHNSYGSFVYNTGMTMNYNYDDFYLNNVDEESGLYKIYKELEAEIPENRTYISRSVPLADYYKYYPINVFFNFDNYVDYLDSNYESEKAEAVAEYFRIPVLENELITLNVEKTAGGFVYYSSSAPRVSYEDDWGTVDVSGYYNENPSEDSFSMYCDRTYAAMTDDAYYFYFSNRTNCGNRVDTSQIPGGYGIYKLPVVNTTDENGSVSCDIRTEDLSMVYPVDVESDILRIYVSRDREKLLLLENRNDELVFSVIDIHSMKLLQQINETCFGNSGLFIYSSTDPSTLERQGGVKMIDYSKAPELEGKNKDFILLRSENMLLILCEENGKYVEKIKCPLEIGDDRTGPEWMVYNYAERSYSFDGERLAVADRYEKLVGDPDGDHYYSYQNSCSVEVGIYTSEGLKYIGDYTCSLEYNSNYLVSHGLLRNDYLSEGLRSKSWQRTRLVWEQ